MSLKIHSMIKHDDNNTILFSYMNINLNNKEEVLKIKPQPFKGNNDCENNACFQGVCNITIDNYKFSNTTDLIIESCPEEVRQIEKMFYTFLYNTEMKCRKPALEKCKSNKEYKTPYIDYLLLFSSQ
ncbi:hypothetical protein U3516DRAFT_775040 [Neocallimastix sp. 'constans']